MPVYVKGRSYRNLPKDGATISSKKRKKKRSVSKKRARWGFEDHTLDEAEFFLNYPLRKEIKKLGDGAVVVDWGCGEGNTIKQISRYCPGATCYGFSREFYKKWIWRKSNALKFIHSEGEDFDRYFKDRSIDFLYSNFGLHYLDTDHNTGRRSLSNYIIKKIIPKLSDRGRIVFDFSKNYNLSSIGRLRKLDGKIIDGRKISIEVKTGPPSVVLSIEK